MVAFCSALQAKKTSFDSTDLNSVDFSSLHHDSKYSSTKEPSCGFVVLASSFSSIFTSPGQHGLFVPCEPPFFLTRPQPRLLSYSASLLPKDENRALKVSEKRTATGQ